MQFHRFWHVLGLLALRFCQFDEVLDLLDVPLEILRTFPPKMVEEALIWRGLAELPRDPLKDSGLRPNRLIAETFLE